MLQKYVKTRTKEKTYEWKKYVTVTFGGNLQWESHVTCSVSYTTKVLFFIRPVKSSVSYKFSKHSYEPVVNIVLLIDQPMAILGLLGFICSWAVLPLPLVLSWAWQFGDFGKKGILGIVFCEVWKYIFGVKSPPWKSAQNYNLRLNRCEIEKKVWWCVNCASVFS